MKRQPTSNEHFEEDPQASRVWEFCGPSFPGTFAASDRGWYFDKDGKPLGNFVQYGEHHYRSPHEYCNDVCKCAQSNPGTIHCVLSEGNDSGPGLHYRYCETIAEAKAFIEGGQRFDAPANPEFEKRVAAASA